MAHNYAINDDVHHQQQGPQGRATAKERSIYTIVTCLPIEADGRPLLTQTITRKADKPVAVNLNVKDVKVLKISVDRETLYSGASLNMADARLQK